MKKRIVPCLLSLLVASTQSHAQTLTDLPNPFEDESYSTTVPLPYSPPQQNAPSAPPAVVVAPKAPAAPQVQQSNSAASVELEMISRQTMGEEFTISVSPARRLSKVQVKALAHSVYIYNAELITISGNRILVSNLTRNSLEKNTGLESENISLNEDVASIVIQVESSGGLADLELTAVSDNGRMSLSSRRARADLGVSQAPAPEASVSNLPNRNFGPIKTITLKKNNSAAICRLGASNGKSYGVFNEGLFTERFDKSTSTIKSLLDAHKAGLCNIQKVACRIGGSNGKATVVANGSSATPGQSLDEAIQDLTKFANAGLCTFEESSCSMGAYNQEAYVIVNGSRVSAKGERTTAVINSLQKLVSSDICKLNKAELTFAGASGSAVAYIGGYTASEKTNLQQSIRNFNTLKNSGLFTFVSSECKLSGSDSKALVLINGSRATQGGDIKSAVNDLKTLLNQKICTNPKPDCSLSSGNGMSSVIVNGYIVDKNTSAAASVSTLQSLTSAGLCQLSKVSCSLSAREGESYPVINGGRSMSGLSLPQALRQMTALANSDLCRIEQTSCSIESSSRGFYARVNGSRASGYLSDLQEVASTMNMLQQSRFCNF